MSKKLNQCPLTVFHKCDIAASKRNDNNDFFLLDMTTKKRASLPCIVKRVALPFILHSMLWQCMKWLQTAIVKIFNTSSHARTNSYGTQCNMLLLIPVSSSYALLPNHDEWCIRNYFSLALNGGLQIKRKKKQRRNTLFVDEGEGGGGKKECNWPFYELLYTIMMSKLCMESCYIGVIRLNIARWAFVADQTWCRETDSKGKYG